MLTAILKAKLHNARVTEADRDYEGSLKIDLDLMDLAGILPYERILVANLENGNRFETYAIPGERGSGTIGLNGATIHQGAVGDRLIVFAFWLAGPAETAAHRPTIVTLDADNRPRGAAPSA